MKKKIGFVFISVALVVLVSIALIDLLVACAPTPSTPQPTPTPTKEFEPVVWVASDMPLVLVPDMGYYINEVPKKLSEATNGLVTFQQHAGMYDASEQLIPLSQNLLQIAAIYNINFSSSISEWSLTFLPFLLNTHEEFQFDFLNNGGFKLYAEDVVKRYGFEVTPIFSCNVGPYYPFSAKPLAKIADMQGLKFRAHPAMEEFLEELGFVYVSVPWLECSLALDRGMIDVIGSGTGSALSMEFEQYTPYRNLWPLSMHFTSTIMVSNKALDALPSDLRKTVLDTLTEQGRYINEVVRYEGEKNLQALIKEKGVIDIQPDPADVVKAQEISQKYIKQWAEQKPEHLELIQLLEKTTGRSILPQ